MLPRVFTVQFVYGRGLNTSTINQFIHCNFLMENSIVGKNLIDEKRANLRIMEKPRIVSVSFGSATQVVINTIASLRIKGKGVCMVSFQFDVYVIDPEKAPNRGYDKNRIIIGRDVLERYLISIDGDGANGNVYFEDKQHYDYYSYYSKAE